MSIGLCLNLLVSHGSNVESGHGELSDEGLNSDLEGLDIGRGLNSLLEGLQRGAGLHLQLKADLDGLVEEVSHLAEVCLFETTSGESGGAETDTTRCKGGSVPEDSVLVEGDGAVVADGLHLRAGKGLGLEIPEDKMVLSATGSEGVSVGSLQLVGHSLGVGTNLACVLLEIRRSDLLELSGDASNLVDVRTTLKAGEDGVVDLGLEVALVFAVEDQACVICFIIGCKNIQQLGKIRIRRCEKLYTVCFSF